ncbi:hypothetical protein OG336_19355 [[Kitasatospora] papulosa]|uniref:hypothetical protein n=1 Tax=[Kitasatospora] papulosa TaxID=1464011 RepID=UPI002E0E228F|nr:hypothetical protein OG336_19355 [[Kitasatospora] papulosa]
MPDPLVEVQALVECFEARLSSAHEGIAFQVMFHARVQDLGLTLADTDGAARAIRIALRHEAADFLRQQPATDLHSVQDLLAREMARGHTLVDPAIHYDARVDVTLLPGDQAAVEALLVAQRKQSKATATRRQELEDLAEELSDPAGVMARWASTDSADWAKRSGEAKTLADLFATYRPPGRRGTEYALVEAVREFLSSFPEPAQKQMVYGLLSAGMQRAERPAHAAKVEEIAEAIVRTPDPPGEAR